MRANLSFVLVSVLVSVLTTLFSPAAASPKANPIVAATLLAAPRLGFLAELSAGPSLGIDRPLKGCSGGILLGMAYHPFEAGIRAGAAYDAALDIGLLRFDLEIGLGSGLRLVVGGLLPLGELSLPGPSGTAIPVTAAAWPDRFGIASTLVDLPWHVGRFSSAIDVELVYTDYHLSSPGGGPSTAAAQALSGAAAFAAGVEVTVAVRLRWGDR